MNVNLVRDSLYHTFGKEAIDEWMGVRCSEPPEKYIPPPTNRNQRPMRPKASKKKRGRA